MITDAWKQIAEKNGLKECLVKLGEECEELDHAIGDYFGELNEATSNAEIDKARDHVVEECADVRACIDQILWHWHGEAECDAIMQWKCVRTMQRMREEERG